MLGTAGLLRAPEATAAAPPGLDHLKCYTVSVGRASGHAANVRLIDQFGTSSAKVAQKPQRLCTPVKKILPSGAVTGISNPRAHLLCYAIRDSLTGSREVLVENQFGRARLTVKGAERLCLPTWKAFRPTFPAAPAPPGLDHFKCYSAQYSSIEPLTFTLPPFVSLSDQFESVRAKIGAPVELCNPVTKVLPSGVAFEPKNPRAHLVCFPISQDPKHVPQAVFTKNQFGRTQLKTVVESRLCVPSFKTVVKTG